MEFNPGQTPFVSFRFLIRPTTGCFRVKLDLADFVADILNRLTGNTVLGGKVYLTGANSRRLWVEIELAYLRTGSDYCISILASFLLVFDDLCISCNTSNIWVNR